MDTLAENQRMLAELRRIRANGLKSLKDQSGEEITYKSDGEIAAAIAALEAHIDRALRGRSNQIRFQTSKGLR